MKFILPILVLIFMTTPVLAAPKLQVRWDSPEKQGIVVSALGEESFVEACLEQGLDAEYRYHVQLCRKRGMWFDGCKDLYRFRQTLNSDPISQKYKLTSDWLDDEAPPKAVTFETLDAAAEALGTIESVPVEFISEGDQEFMDKGKIYVGIRVYSQCKGEYSRTLEEVAYFLTLGFLRINGFNTGTVNFSLSD